MDKLLFRLVFYRKLLLHRHNYHLPQCVSATRSGFVPQTTPKQCLSHLTCRLCHNDAPSSDPTDNIVEKVKIPVDTQEVGGDGRGKDESTHGDRSLESKPVFAVDNESQGSALKSTGEDLLVTQSSNFVQDASSSSNGSTSVSTDRGNSEHSSESSEETSIDEEKPKNKEPPVAPDPETCCESGCVNCVWIKYAEEVKEYYPDHEERIKEILDMIEDYNVKMFVRMELASNR